MLPTDKTNVHFALVDWRLSGPPDFTAPGRSLAIAQEMAADWAAKQKEGTVEFGKPLAFTPPAAGSPIAPAPSCRSGGARRYLPLGCGPKTPPGNPCTFSMQSSNRSARAAKST